MYRLLVNDWSVITMQMYAGVCLGEGRASQDVSTGNGTLVAVAVLTRRLIRVNRTKQNKIIGASSQCCI